MKLNKFATIGLVIGLIGGLGGMVVAIATAPGEGIGISIVFIAIFFGVYWFFFRPMITSNRILKNGEQREGKILQVWDTGVTINNNPQIGLLLEVKDRYGKPYQVKSKLLISRLQVADVRPGTTVTVRVDPHNDQKVAVEALGAAAGATNISKDEYQESMQHVLEAFEAENNELMRIGISAEARVLAFFDLNIKVNGDNPFAILFLEVQPGLKPPFYADAKGVIAAQAVSKFQPGEMITVKYDPNNVHRVTVEHS